MSFAIQISGFALVGLAATIFQYGLMAIMIQIIGIEVVFASTLSYASSALFNYILNRQFVFHSKAKHFHSLPKFIAIVILGLLLNSFLMNLAVNKYLLHWLMAQLIVTLTIMIVNFLLSKYWAFQPDTTPTSNNL